MAENTLFVGLDVHKKTISVATVDGSAGSTVQFYGTVANTPDALRVLCKKLSKGGRPLHACYEAGPCGYNVQRHGPPWSPLRCCCAVADPEESR